ncbi:MFS transporter [Phenylobacterium sp. J367]|uniref:MFS transporter n=1 Tax=Phenylobacterium sp. J367 TaxID=2898435 RepID=UPI0021517781|nr:MFS transporter [Phenylobacterium sp. J367]
MAEVAIDKPQIRTPRGRVAEFFRRGDPENLSPGQLAAYGLPTIPLQAMLAPMGIFLAPFYTGELGITLTTWAIILGVTRIVDIVLDPLVGIVSDRLPSRWGRRRHWVVGATPLHHDLLRNAVHAADRHLEAHLLVRPAGDDPVQPRHLGPATQRDLLGR